MSQKLKLLAIVPSKEHKSTIYFFNEKTNHLLPINIATKKVENALQKNKLIKPNTYNTVKRIINALGGKINKITIYHHQEKTFYTYIQIAKQDETYEINASLEDALGLALETKAPVTIENHVLEVCGFTVTKEMIKEALV